MKTGLESWYHGSMIKSGHNRNKRKRDHDMKDSEKETLSFFYCLFLSWYHTTGTSLKKIFEKYLENP